jgi:hypothetical protein
VFTQESISARLRKMSGDALHAKKILESLSTDVAIEDSPTLSNEILLALAAGKVLRVKINGQAYVRVENGRVVAAPAPSSKSSTG